MRFFFGSKRVTDPTGKPHDDPIVVHSRSVNLKREHATYLAIASALLLGAAGFFASRAYPASRVAGTVTGVESRGRESSSPTYRPIVTFFTNDRVRREVRGTAWSSKVPRKGDRVDVLYDPAEPASAVIDRPAERWTLPIILGVFGLMTGVMAIVARVFAPGRYGSRD